MSKHTFLICLVGIGCSLVVSMGNSWARSQFTPTTSAGPPSGYSGGGSQGGQDSGSYTQTYDPVAEQHTEGRTINEQGISYYNAQNWAKAVEYFENALKKWPENEIMQQNLASAKYRLNEETAQKERAQQEAEAAEKMRHTLLNSSAEFATPPAAVTTTQSSSSDLGFMSPGDLARSTQGKTTGNSKAVDQANTIDIDTRNGLAGNDLTAKVQSGKTFDDPVRIIPAEVAPAVDLTGMGRRPEWPERIRKDKELVKLQKAQDALNATYLKKDAELAKIRKEMESATPARKSELAVTAVKVKADLSKAEYNIALKEKEIRKRAKRLIDTTVEKTQ